MTTIEEFIKAREAIEKLATQIIVLVENKSVRESRKFLDEAKGKLEVLETMVANDIQVKVMSRLTAQLGGLSIGNRRNLVSIYDNNNFHSFTGFWLQSFFYP